MLNKASTLKSHTLHSLDAADSVQQVETKVDDLTKIYFSIGVMSSKVIPDQYVVPPNEFTRERDGAAKTTESEEQVNR